MIFQCTCGKHSKHIVPTRYRRWLQRAQEGSWWARTLLKKGLLMLFSCCCCLLVEVVFMCSCDNLCCKVGLSCGCFVLRGLIKECFSQQIMGTPVSCSLLMSHNWVYWVCDQYNYLTKLCKIMVSIYY